MKPVTEIMKPIPAIAIFDIGKTNKKLFLFDEEYRIVLERTIQFAETSDEDGDPCENLEELTQWVRETLRDVFAIRKFAIRAVNFSAYGASFVHLDKKRELAAPLYSYLKAYPESLKRRFYDTYGPEPAVALQTASPVLGSLNSGMQLYRIKQENPRLFSRIQWSLHLPQYLSFLVTGKPAADITSIGCHTQLWNFQLNDYHDWVYREGLVEKFPAILPAENTLTVYRGAERYEAGIGLHDSSAALIPYLAGFSEPFVLISTGTWCISLNPFNRKPLTAGELAHDCLCYMDYKGNPVKAARLFAGQEHEEQCKRLADHFHTAPDHYKKVKYNPGLLAEYKPIHDGSDGVPMMERSAFGLRDLSAFGSYEEAYHCLLRDIMTQQQASAQLVIRDTKVKRIFVDGGFSKNAVYMHLLAAAFPHLEVFAASVAQASAVGAALAIHSAWNSRPLPGDMIEMKYYRVTQHIEI